MNTDLKFDEAKKVLQAGFVQAKEILKDESKLEHLLQRLEKIEVIPKVGEYLAMIPTMAAMVKSYASKEYREIPLGSILAIISALVYFVSPIDIIPDAISSVGHIDDALVILACQN